jgi:hypothetical protein
VIELDRVDSRPVVVSSDATVRRLARAAGTLRLEVTPDVADPAVVDVGLGALS